MTSVTLSDLRKRAGTIIDRAAAGERLIVTRRGEPVCELWLLPITGPDQPEKPPV